MKKIVAIGPESTGKSTLCQQLAQHFGTTWVPEYAREYLLQHGARYTYNDLLHIAKAQITLEEKYTRAAFAAAKAKPLTAGVPSGPKSFDRQLPAETKPLFIDTDLYVLKVWCEFVYDQCHQWILDQIAARAYDLYLLCNIDLPWEQDGLREYPDLLSRQQLYNIYKDILINQPVPWVEISGTPDNRIKTAIAATSRLLQH